MPCVIKYILSFFDVNLRPKSKCLGSPLINIVIDFVIKVIELVTNKYIQKRTSVNLKGRIIFLPPLITHDDETSIPQWSCQQMKHNHHLRLFCDDQRFYQHWAYFLQKLDVVTSICVITCICTIYNYWAGCIRLC